MSAILLTLTALLSPPGLSHGIVPGMTSEQVETKLGESSYCNFGTGPFGKSTTSWYRRSELVVHYELGKVQSVQRQSP